MAGVTWNCCHLNAFCVHHTTTHHVTSCKATYIRCLSVTCHLHLLAEWLGSFMCYCGFGKDTKIRTQKVDLGDENSPTGSCRDSNSWPFNHKSGALTTELSPLPMWQVYFMGKHTLKNPWHRMWWMYAMGKPSLAEKKHHLDSILYQFPQCQ